LYQLIKKNNRSNGDVESARGRSDGTGDDRRRPGAHPVNGAIRD
jgi:hypothetical protein